VTLPLPSPGRVRRQLATLRIEADQVDGDRLSRHREDLQAYAGSHARRLARSLRLVAPVLPRRRRPPRILELGAAPYFFSALVQRYLGCSVTGVNVRAGAWPGNEGDPRESGVLLRQAGPDGGELACTLPVWVLNIEKDPFPFPDRSFDLVLFMETLEHLAYSPSHVLGEAGRVLHPKGALFLSTPNAVDMVKSCKLMLNRPIAFPYSGYGVYGRHNREYTVGEIRELLAACGFQVVRSRLENPYVTLHPPTAYNLATTLLQLPTFLPLPLLGSKRQYIYVTARPGDRIRASYPEKLYLFPDLYSPPAGEPC